MSLECLGILHILKDGQSSDIIDLSLTIEDSKPSLESARDMAMYIRRLGASYAAVPQTSWISKLVPFYLFGMPLSFACFTHILTLNRYIDYAVFPHMEGYSGGIREGGRWETRHYLTVGF